MSSVYRNVQQVVLAAAGVGFLTVASTASAATLVDLKFTDNGANGAIVTDSSGSGNKGLMGFGINAGFNWPAGSTLPNSGDLSTNTPGWTSSGLVFNAASHVNSGNNQVDIAAITPTALGSSWTIESIAKYTGTATTAYLFGGPYNARNTFRLGVTDGQLIANWGTGWQGTGGIWLKGAAQTNLLDGQTHAFSVVMDGSTMKCSIYVDGQLQLQGTAASSMVDYTAANPNADGTFFVGQNQNAPNWTGLISEARVSNTALIPSQLLTVPEPAMLGVLLLAGSLGMRRRRV